MENTTQQKLYDTQNSTESNNNLNSNLKINKDKIEKIEDTIFGIVNDPEKGWFLTIGQHVITETFNTKNEALDQLEKDKWNIIMKMIILVVDATTLTMIEETINTMIKPIKSPCE